jgi:hypothetical protein
MECQMPKVPNWYLRLKEEVKKEVEEKPLLATQNEEGNNS